MFSEERGAGSSPHIAMPHALRTWLPPAEVDAQIFDTPALQEDLGAVLVESQSPAEAAGITSDDIVARLVEHFQPSAELDL